VVRAELYVLLIVSHRLSGLNNKYLPLLLVASDASRDVATQAGLLYARVGEDPACFFVVKGEVAHARLILVLPELLRRGARGRRRVASHSLRFPSRL
jgi:hypothetical protein